ncbi:hypothetical protein ScPMuIL_008773 [Solemya velum]
MAGVAEIREGFLCPICMKDLGTVSQLQDHFEEEHSSEDKDVLQQLRGLFDKAKKRILGDKEGGDSTDAGETRKGDNSKPSGGIPGFDPSVWEPQDDGVTRSHTDMFRSIRDERIDRYVVETNKLLIRLDKLVVNDGVFDHKKRKAYEKSVVNWIPDNQVPKCPTCGRSFTLTKRRHHCRLCGGIMCDRCSQFLTNSYARKLTDPAFQFEGENGFLKRSDSNSSLNSIASPEGEVHVRTCQECRKLLERRDQLVEQRNTKPTIVLLYEKMRSCISDCDVILEQYIPMVESLSIGESSYSFQDAQRYRLKLVKLYEAVDQLSKRIMVLGFEDDKTPAAKQIILQKAIRSYASTFMQENMMGLQALPTIEQYTNLQEKRKIEIQQRIAYERQVTIEAQEREKRIEESHHKDVPIKSSNTSPTKAVVDRERSDSQKVSGWKPQVEPKFVNSSSDPMIQQINIIQGYIKQAKQVQKWDEVEMLEQNLKELQKEYMNQQRQNWS